MEIFTFDKSLQERLTEYTEILSRRGEIVPASQIRSEWSCHVELVIEPVGWQALWKIPRLTCQDFEIHYPTIVVVEVENVDFAELSALVKIIAVQEEIHLPEKYDVPLIELYPTRNQENIALDLLGTATCVDQLRFFFNYLWMPWDVDDDDNADWVSVHLEPRIRLFFDMKRGVVWQNTCDVIRTLVREGREIETRISRLEADILDEEQDREGSPDEGKTCLLMQFHFRLRQIKAEVEVLENPVMREMLKRNQESWMTSKEIKRRESGQQRSEGYFVWLGGSIEETIEFLNKIKAYAPADIFLKTSNCLQEALDASDVDDMIVLGPGEYQISGAGGLEPGGTIKGICDSKRTVICPKETESGPSLLDFSGGEVVLEDISVDLGELQVGLLARKGSVKIDGCKIFALNKSVVKLGIVVLPGAKLSVRRTTFVGLGTAVVVHADGKATLDECSFEDCIEGVQFHDNSSLTIAQCAMSDFKEFAFRMETQRYLDGPEGKTGGLELLENVTEVHIRDCTFENNGKGNVSLRPRVSAALATRSEVTTMD